MEQPGRAPSGYKLARAKLPAASDAVEEAAPPPPKKRNRVLDPLNKTYLNDLYRKHTVADETACNQFDVDHKAVVEELRALLNHVDDSFKDTEDSARILEGVMGKWKNEFKVDKLSENMRRVLIEDAVQFARPELNSSKLATLLGTSHHTIKSARERHVLHQQGVCDCDCDCKRSLGERAAKQREIRSDAFVENLREPVGEFFHSHSKYDADRKKFILLFTRAQLHVLWCTHHDVNGKYWAKGSPAWLRYRIAKLDGEDMEWINPISYSSFCSLTPTDVEPDEWRCCCCQHCLEIDDQIDLWGVCMEIMHSDEDTQRSVGRTVMDLPMCTDPDCPWKQDGGPRLPNRFPIRFKNIITDKQRLKDLYPDLSERPPSLFCDECGCEGCSENPPTEPVPTTTRPDHLACRHVDTGLTPEAPKCDKCGWKNKFPRCPTFAGLEEKMEWRALKSTLLAVPECKADAEGKSTSKSRKISDRLLPTMTTPRVFLDTVERRMDDWLSHYYFDTHQLRARNAAVEAVASAPPGERLVILTDWAEKLGLVPPSSSTGGTYEQLGLLMNVCIYKDARGVRVETHAVLADSEVNDVPHTHTGLQKIVAHYANRSKQQKVKLTSISIWSDGGPKHFKCAENVFFCAHLQGFARARSDNEELVMVWNFMCAYHGKGPYDAEGGLIKYYVRRAMKFRGIAFTSAGDVVTWLKGSGEVRRGSAQVKNARSRGTFHQMRQFTISERFFHHVEEADVVGLQKGFFFTNPVASTDPNYSGPLQKLRDAYALRFGPIPSVVAVGAGRFAAGITPPSTSSSSSSSSSSSASSSSSSSITTTTPYAPATLGAMRVPIQCWWSRLSCFCGACLGTRPGVCTSPAPWQSCVVSRKPHTGFTRAWVAEELAVASLADVAAKNAAAAAAVVTSASTTTTAAAVTSKAVSSLPPATAALLESYGDTLTTRLFIYQRKYAATALAANVFLQESGWAAAWCKAQGRAPGSTPTSHIDFLVGVLAGVGWKPSPTVTNQKKGKKEFSKAQSLRSFVTKSL